MSEVKAKPVAPVMVPKPKPPVPAKEAPSGLQYSREPSGLRLVPSADFARDIKFVIDQLPPRHGVKP